MNANYVIRWKSKVNGRAGKGTKIFTREEAEELAAELNREYPQIEHEPFEMGGGPGATNGGPSIGEEQHANVEEAEQAFGRRSIELSAA